MSEDIIFFFNDIKDILGIIKEGCHRIGNIYLGSRHLKGCTRIRKWRK